MRPSSDCDCKENSMSDPEKGHVMVFVTGIRWFPSVSDDGNGKNGNDLQLSHGEFLPTCPALKEGFLFVFFHWTGWGA